MTTDVFSANEALAGKPAERGRPMALVGGATIVGALLIAAASFTILLGLTPITPNVKVTLILIAVNSAFILLLMAMIGREVYRIAMARKRGRAASRLHVRIVAMFALVAAIPAILVAIVASVTLDIGLDRWFQIRTKVIINSSLSIAEAYVQENARNLRGTTLSMAYDLDQARLVYNLDRNGFRSIMEQEVKGRELANAVLMKSDGSLVMEADTKTSHQMPDLSTDIIKQAQSGEPVLVQPRSGGNIVGTVIKLKEIPNMLLYTIKELDPEVIRARQIVRANTDEYRGMEENRMTTQVAFALVYIGLTLIIVLSAIWTGITVADRLVRPIRQLIGAADEVSTGNLNVSVPVRASDGDVASLGDTFNKMIHQLKSQRDELVNAKDVIDERRRFSEAVLAGVTAGVIGVDTDGVISIVNRSAETMLAISADNAVGQNLSAVLPHIGRVFEVGRTSERPAYRDTVTFFRAGTERTFNVQITVEEGETDAARSYVVTVDDITDLVQAQRSTAWADVARRIAHEIKNPLTPIQLSAERIRRRYGKVITEDREVFDQCTDTIIRQVGDIGRMVDEFSSFARMPKPDMKLLDLREPLREASFLVEVSRHNIKFERDFGEEPLVGTFDTRLLSQAFGNVIKNAAEAIDAVEMGAGEGGVIRIRARRKNNTIAVDVMDNGKGLPRENRQRLLEPYMTTREKGTGLGLAIVRKIVEDHGGRLELHDAPAGFHGGRGALIRFLLPAAPAGKSSAKAPASGAAREGADRETEKVGNGV